jgi:hypothetical protein
MINSSVLFDFNKEQIPCHPRAYSAASCRSSRFADDPFFLPIDRPAYRSPLCSGVVSRPTKINGIEMLSQIGDGKLIKPCKSTQLKKWHVRCSG